MSQQPSNLKVIFFIVTLSFICAFILSALASALAEPKEIAKELDRSKQMLIAAQILNHDGYFMMLNEEGEHVPAKYTQGGVLVPGTKQDIATKEELIKILKERLIPFLVNSKGKSSSFEEAGVNPAQYVAEYKKTGYYRQPWKLVYKILPNPKNGEKPVNEPIGYVFPINGFGLWDAIYGYLAIASDGDTVIGISWYEQKETPGLGANIADAPWQSLFPGKKIFQESPSGETDFKTAPIGIQVVKGKVSEVLGDVPKAKSAVDGMAGATLTGNGVTDAYKDVMEAYRPFLIQLHQETTS